ncbi:3'-5' exonuclease [Sphaerotilus montanus]|uniref:DNA 3'-5' helicase II n=1 Tax=Sphaerotilus montanus TaxID=522889 RepID=A0A7Y9R4N1_9BURK|nr:3'-5' exonuclease [Sphaerotilus montanus]NYG35498.1 superfamily I DNA/RNA helicase [Sphaerotilus montanus]
MAYLDQAFVAVLNRLGIELCAFPTLVEHRKAFFASSQARLEKLQKSGADYITDLSFFKKVFRERTGITVSTIHGVKGAEFDVVIAFGLLQGMVPHFSDSDGDAAASKLLYVLASRARKHLHLISEAGRSRGRYGSYEPTEVLARFEFDYNG